MKKIGIDARLYFQTGVGVYLRNLLYYLAKNNLNDIQFYVYLMKGDEKKIAAPSSKFIYRPVSYRWHSAMEQIGFASILFADNLDLMHFTYFSYPILYKKKFLATIHDVTPLYFKTGRASSRGAFIYNVKHFGFRQVLGQQVKSSTAIITPTHTVKQQIIDIFGKNYQNKIIPIYEGVDYGLIQAKLNGKYEKQYPDPYFIYVGNFYPHKNVEALIQAFCGVDFNHKLLLVGPKDYFSDNILKLIKGLAQEDRIRFVHSPGNNELSYLYKHAKAIIHPSRSEGFGLPLIEAMYFKTPIIASDIAVFRELLNNQFVKFDPNDVRDITLKINDFIADEHRSDYKNTIEQYNFETMTHQTLKLYRQLLGKI